MTFVGLENEATISGGVCGLTNLVPLPRAWPLTHSSGPSTVCRAHDHPCLCVLQTTAGAQEAGTIPPGEGEALARPARAHSRASALRSPRWSPDLGEVHVTRMCPTFPQSEN